MTLVFKVHIHWEAFQPSERFPTAYNRRASGAMGPWEPLEWSIEAESIIDPVPDTRLKPDVTVRDYAIR